MYVMYICNRKMGRYMRFSCRLLMVLTFEVILTVNALVKIIGILCIKTPPPYNDWKIMINGIGNFYYIFL